MKPSEPLVTFPLRTIVKDLLKGEHYREVSETTADCLLAVTNNRHTCHIQFPSDDDVDICNQPIFSPVLWEIGAWKISSERWLKQKLLSQKRIDEYNIKKANINRVARAVLRMACVNPDQARVLAMKWLDRGDFLRIQAVGVNKLIENVSEL